MANEKTIWVVEGSTGEYSDHIEWPVKAFDDEGAANVFCERVSARYREIVALFPGGYLQWSRARYESDPVALNELDPAMQMDYTGTNYLVYPIQLVLCGEEADHESLS